MKEMQDADVRAYCVFDGKFRVPAKFEEVNALHCSPMYTQPRIDPSSVRLSAVKSNKCWSYVDRLSNKRGRRG